MIRECFTCRPGNAIVGADFPSLELFTLAQTCYTWFGHSALGEMLKAGTDPHTAFASKLVGCSYEEGLVLKDAEEKGSFYDKRQIAKAFNFGKPGGLGPQKLCDLAMTPAHGRTYISLEDSREYGKVWLQTFPEMTEYFARVNKLLYGKETGTIVIPGTGFVRGGAKYCAIANTPFQGLGAACAKNAMWLVAKAEYTEPESPLFGSRTVAMVHDEILAECKLQVVHEAGHELARLMVLGANKYLPDCPIPLAKVKPVAMLRWSKIAKPVFDAGGRLIPWTPAVAA